MSRPNKNMKLFSVRWHFFLYHTIFITFLNDACAMCYAEWNKKKKKKIIFNCLQNVPVVQYAAIQQFKSLCYAMDFGFKWWNCENKLSSTQYPVLSLVGLPNVVIQLMSGEIEMEKNAIKIDSELRIFLSMNHRFHFTMVTITIKRILYTLDVGR